MPIFARSKPLPDTFATRYARQRRAGDRLALVMCLGGFGLGLIVHQAVHRPEPVRPASATVAPLSSPLTPRGQATMAELRAWGAGYAQGLHDAGKDVADLPAYQRTP